MEQLPVAVRAFLDEHIFSASQLEVLLLLRDRSDVVGLRELARTTALPQSSLGPWLDAFVSRGLLRRDGEQYAYAPQTRAVAAVVDEVAQVWSRRKTTVTRCAASLRTGHGRPIGTGAHVQQIGLTEAQAQARFGGALVVAVDDSRPAVAALRFAAKLAERSGEPLHVLLVWNLVIGPSPAASTSAAASEQDRQAEADRVLTALVEDALGDAAQLDLRLHAVHGNVDPLLEGVSRVAEHLVVGSRGHGGVADLLLGSTSEHLVHHARCPITVVPSGRG